MNVESKLWKLESWNHQVAIIQKASGAIRYVCPSALPDVATLAAVSENRFNAIAREAFHNAAQR